MTRALVAIADAEPEWTSDGQPVCSQSCPSHDGKRCQLIGFRPSMLCEPAVVAMADEIRRLHALPVLRTCAPCRYWRSGTSFLDEPVTTRCWKVSPPLQIDVDAPPPATCPLRGGAR